MIKSSYYFFRDIVDKRSIIFELQDAQQLFKQEGKVNYVHATLKNQELVYDTRDNAKTLANLREIAEEIQIEVGFDYFFGHQRGCIDNYSHFFLLYL